VERASSSPCFGFCRLSGERWVTIELGDDFHDVLGSFDGLEKLFRPLPEKELP